MSNNGFDSLNTRLDFIEAQLLSIQSRNVKVETQKAWEQSYTRILSIVFITFLLTTLIFFLIGVSRPWLSAIIPTVGYILSTLTLTYVKTWWLKSLYKN